MGCAIVAAIALVIFTWWMGAKWTHVTGVWPLDGGIDCGDTCTRGWAATRFLDFVKCDEAELEREKRANKLTREPAGNRNRKLPSKFLGDWCGVINNSNESAGATYRRGSCRDSDAGMTVRVNGFSAWESDCRVLSVTPTSNGKYQAKFKCEGEGETSTVNYRMSLDNKGQLIMK